MIHEIYPQYSFQKNKGYGTREHMKALENYGPTPLHRLTYKPVKKVIKFDVVKKWIDDSLIKRERLFKLGIF
jgi:ribonuclease HII